MLGLSNGEIDRSVPVDRSVLEIDADLWQGCNEEQGRRQSVANFAQHSIMKFVSEMIRIYPGYPGSVANSPYASSMVLPCAAPEQSWAYTLWTCNKALPVRYVRQQAQGREGEQREWLLYSLQKYSRSSYAALLGTLAIGTCNALELFLTAAERYCILGGGSWCN